LPDRPENTPYAVKLDVDDITGLKGILQATRRYVSLDRSGSAITVIPEEAFT
jgi:hypothetical protein